MNSSIKNTSTDIDEMVPQQQQRQHKVKHQEQPAIADTTTTTTTTTSSSTIIAKQKQKQQQQQQQQPIVDPISSFQLYQKPKQLTPQRCHRIVKYARKRLRGVDNNSVDAFDNTKLITTTTATTTFNVTVTVPVRVPVLTHSQIELGRLLGKGAFSSVYSIKSIINKNKEDDEQDEEEQSQRQCQSQSQQCQIVVKFLRSKLYDNHGLFAASAADLVKEGKILSTLGHRNIIRLHAVSSKYGVDAYLNGYHDGYFLVLERLERTLSDRINEWQSRHKELYEENNNNNNNNDDEKAQSREQQDQQEEAIVSSSTHGTTSWRNKLTSSIRLSKNKSESLEISERSNASSSTYTSTSSEDGDSESNHLEEEDMNALLRTNLLDERLDVTLQLADAIAYLHDQNVLHRDLKPDNIGFDKNGVLKVFDFDIARVVPGRSNNNNNDDDDDSWSCPEDSLIFQSSSSSNVSRKHEDETFLMTQKVGSPRYMSPECARREPYNLKADVYSFALLTHQVLTLQKPYDDISDEDHDEFVFYKGVRPNLPSGLPTKTKSLLKKAWSHIISERPTMKMVRRVLSEERSKILRFGTIGRNNNASMSMTMPMPTTAAYVESCSFTAISDNNEKVIKMNKMIKKNKKIESKKNKNSKNKNTTKNKNKSKGLFSMFRRNNKKVTAPIPKIPLPDGVGAHRHDPQEHRVTSRFRSKLASAA